MFRASLLHFASALPLVALAAPARADLGAGSIRGIATDPIVLQAGVANGAWIEAVDGTAELRGVLLDDGGLELYDLVAQATPVSDLHGLISGELFPRIHAFLPVDEKLLLYGQYVVSDASSGMFRATVVRAIGVLGPQVPVGVIDGKYARLQAIAQGPLQSQLAAAASGGAGIAGAAGGPGASDVGQQSAGGQIVCPREGGTQLSGASGLGSASGAEAGAASTGSKTECPYVSSKRMRAFVATHPVEGSDAATKPLVTGLGEAQHARRLREALTQRPSEQRVALGMSSAKKAHGAADAGELSAAGAAGVSSSHASGGMAAQRKTSVTPPPLGGPIPVAQYKGVFTAVWAFGL